VNSEIHLEDCPLISIIILSYERYDDLCRSLDSIYQLNHPNIEVVVVDNNSSDQRIQSLSERYQTTKFIFLVENMGTSVTRNAGAAVSRGEYIWFLDDDIEIVEPDYVKHVLERFNTNSEIGAIGGEASLDESDTIVGTKKLVLDHTGFTNGIIDKSEYGELREVKCLATCNLFLRREAFESVGGFDPWFFFYLEDLDLTYRIHQEGYKLAVFGQVPVIHWTSFAGRKTVIIEPRKNRAYFILKNFPYKRLLIMPLYDILYIIKPKNFLRMVKFARKSDLEAAAFYRGGESLTRKLTFKKLLWGIAKGMTFSASIYLGYLMVLPSLFKALKKRGFHEDNISKKPIEKNILRPSYADI